MSLEFFLGHCSDQTIEAVHQVVNQRFLNSKYYIKFTDSDKQGEKLFNGIMHVNSYNIWYVNKAEIIDKTFVLFISYLGLNVRS